MWETFTLTWAVQGVAVSATLLGWLLFRILEHITQTVQLGFAGGEGAIQQLSGVYTAVSATFIVSGWSVVQHSCWVFRKPWGAFRGIHKQSSNCDYSSAMAVWEQICLAVGHSSILSHQQVRLESRGFDGAQQHCGWSFSMALLATSDVWLSSVTGIQFISTGQFEDAPTRPRMRKLLRMCNSIVQAGDMISQGKEKLCEEAFVLLVCLLLSCKETLELLLSNKNKQHQMV